MARALLAPTRVGLRLDAASQRRLRAWLGPRSRVELEHVIKTQFRTALIANALFVLIALGWNDPLVLAVALGSLATGVAARFAPRAWQLLLSGVLSLLLAARQAWLVAHDQVRSVPLGILVIVGCVLAGIPFLVMYRRFSGVDRGAP